MDFNATTIKNIQQVMNPKELHDWFWLERKIIDAAIQNINYIVTPWNYPYENAGIHIISWAKDLGFFTHIINDKIMIYW